MTCKHSWVVTGMAEIDDQLMETQGHLLLTCAKCSAIARLERPTYFECYLVAKGWVRGEETCFTDSIGGDDRLVIVLEGARADDLLTAGDDDQINALGTMGWLETAADDWQAHEFDHLAEHAPTSCTHMWHVNGVIGLDTDAPDIELFCARCHEYGAVDHPTQDECETITKAWSMGMALEWQNNDRVTLYRDLPPSPPQVQLTLRRGNADEFNEVDDQPRPPVADLVDHLDLFEGEDDEDIPF